MMSSDSYGFQYRLVNEREGNGGAMTAPDERSQRLLIENAMGDCLRASWEVSYGDGEGTRQPFLYHRHGSNANAKQGRLTASLLPCLVTWN